MIKVFNFQILLLLALVILAGCQASGGGGGAGGGIITPPNPAYTTTISGTTNHIADNTDTSTITITVFEGPTPIAGVVPTFAVSGSNNLIATCSATDVAGTSTCSLRSSKAEVKSIQVLLPNFSTTSTVTFITGPVSTASTITSAGPVTANGTSAMTINVSLRDAFGNFVSGVVPTFDATNTSGGNAYGACTASSASGNSVCTMTSTRAEVKLLRLTSPVTVSGGPAFFFSGPPVAANSSISGTTPHSADGVDASTVSIGLYDAFMNPAAGVVPTFNATGSGNTYTACSQTAVTGIATCTMTSTVGGVKTLSIQTPFVKAGSPVTFNAVVGAPVAANSTITGTSPVIADGVATSTVTITLRDAASVGVPGIIPTFSATNTNNGNSYGVCSTTDASGISTCTLSSTGAETKTLMITGPVTKPDGTVVFVPGPPSSVTSTITGSSPVLADGTATSTISITIRDAFNNPIPGETPTFSATDTGMQNVYGSCSVTDATGLSTCTLASTIAETKTLQLLTPVAVTGGTVVFTAGVAVAANSNITGTSPKIADGVDSSLVTITLRDINNNPVSGQIPTFGATDTGTTNVYGACSATNASGVSTCTLTSLNAETKTLSITAPVVKADGTVIFLPAGASVANSSITGSSPVIADGVATSTVTITLRDANNNPIAGTTPLFGATDTGTTNTYGACSATDASGVSTCTLASTRAENKTLSITSPITKPDGSVLFIAGAPSSVTSTITGSSPVIADGAATSTISINIRDAFNNPISGQTPTFSATDTGMQNVYGSCSVTDVAGLSTCTLSSTIAETKTLQLLTPVTVTGGTVVFTAGAPVAANSTITGTTPVVADGSATSTVTITLADINNNLVAGVTPTFSATDTGTTNTYGACSASNASGISTCTLASTFAETKTLSITAPFVKAGTDVVFTAAGAVAANSTITGTGPVVADGTASSTITITLRDANNNPVPGEVPTFGATNTGTTNGYGVCSVSNASGISTCTLTSLRAETKTLAIATPVVKPDGTVIFTAGLPVAANSNITGSSPVIADGTATSTVTITLRDANNNTVSGETPTFDATDTGTTNTYGSCSVSDASGVSTCTMTSLRAETKTLAIATPVVKADGTVIFTAGTPVAANSNITGTTPVVADGSATSTVTITLADINNNLVAGVTPTFSATDTGTTNVYSACSASNASGISTCTLASTFAETKTLSIATPFVKAGSNVVFSAAGAVAANSTITGSGPVIANGSATSTVTITLRDANNNPVSGETPTFGATDTGTTNAYGSCSVTNASGVSTCTMTSLRAETKTLSIATPVVKADGTVVFTAGSPVAANSNITGTTPVVANGSATSTITITLRDANNNTVAGETPTFSATDTGTTNAYGSCSVTNASGVSTCTMTSLKAESKVLSIATPFVKADGTVIFTAGAPVAANSSITGTTPVVANGSATSTVTITLADVNNNLVSGVTPTFSATDTGTTNTYGSCSASNASGVSTCTLASTVAETKTLSIATPFIKAGSNVVFTAAGAVAANSTITGTGPVVADGTATSTVTITLRDANNNAVSGQTPTFGATDSGTTNAYGSCSVSNASGVSTCTMTSLRAETKTLAIATPVVKPDGTVIFTAGIPVAANSNITGSSPVVADGSATSTITITLRDANNNTVSGETPTFGATDTGTTNSYGSCSVTNASGVSTCTLSSLKAESKTLAIATPVSKSDGTVIFTAGSPVAANSTIVGTGPVVANGSATSTVTITLQDVNSNPVSGIVPTFSATDTGTTNSNGVCSATNASGVSTCTLSSLFAEVKTLSIATPVSKVGGTVTFTAASAVAANSNITGTGPVIADGTATSTVTITLRDGANNPVSGQTPTFSATDSGTTNAYGSCSVTNASGVSTCTLTSLRAETKTLSITAPVTKSDGTVIFTAGTPVAANSNITGSSPVIANGSATSTITITLRDANNNTVSGQTPTFGATDTGTTNAYGPCSVTNASGVSTCTMTSLRAETKTLSIATPVSKADGTVIFTAGAPVAANSNITGTGPVIANGSATSTVTINLRDVNNNPVSGQTPTFYATDTGTTNAYGVCSSSNATGDSTCTLSSLGAETKTLSITAPVTKAGGTVVFTAGSAVAANSNITGTGPVIANGSATSTVTITLRDASNNPVSGITPTFAATDTGSGNTYQACSVTNASGVSTCTMRSTRAETKTLSIVSPVAKADGTVVFTAGPAVAANSNVTGTGPIVADNVAASTITVSLRDANNNPVPGITPVYASTGTGNTVVACGATNASGDATCSLRSTRAQIKTLSITSPVTRTGGTVTFTAGSPSATTTTITGTTPVSADGVSTSFISITILDVNSNPVSGVTPIFNATDTNSTNVYGACQVSDATGLSLCTLASTRAEFKTLQLTSPVAVTGDVVEFSSSLPVSANSTITGTSPHAANGATDSTITITLRDANNNPVAGIEPTFAATNTGSGNTYDTCSLSDAGGVSTCTMQSTVAETKTLQITTPVTRTGGTITFTAGAPDVAASTIAGTGPVIADNVATSTVTVTLRDSFNNPISGLTPTFTTSGTGNTQTGCTSTNASGVSTCTIRSTTAEVKTLAIATPVVKTGGTVTFTAGTAVAANSTITGTGPTNPDGISISTITITLKDVNNNNVSGITPTFSATGTNNTYNACSVSNASGVSTCSMTSTTAETKTLSIQTPFVKSDGTVVFASGSPSVANSSIVATGPVIANNVATSLITITLRDNVNAPVIGTIPTFSANGSDNFYDTCSATNASGVSTCTMRSTKAEDKTVSIATPIVKAGNTITFQPGAPSASTSTIVCDAASYKADDTDTCAITVSITDAFNNAIEGTTPTISVSGTNNTVTACSATDFAGESTCTLKSSQAEGKFLSIVTPVVVNNPTEYPFYPNGIDMQVPIELIDRGIIGTAAIYTWNRSRTSLDTTKYVADTVEYFLEVSAANTNGSAYQLSLVDETNAVVTGTSFSVPGGTTNPRRFRWPFDPVAGAHNYRIRTPATGTNLLRIHSARIIVQMANAVEAELYIPMATADVAESTADSGSAAQIMAATTATYSNTGSTSGNFSHIIRNDSLYDAIPATNGWALEAIMSGGTGVTASAALFDRGNNQHITQATTNITGGTVNMNRVSFNSNATNFNNADTLEVRFRSSSTSTCRLFKVGLWVRVRFVKKAEIYWRIGHHRRTTSTTLTYLPDARFLYESAWYSNPTISFLAMGSSTTANQGFTRLIDIGTSDTANTGGTIVSTATHSTTYGSILNAVTLTNGNRYVLTHQRGTAGTATLGGAFFIIRTTE